MPGSTSSTPSGAATRARRRWFCTATCWPRRGATATPHGRTPPPHAIPRSARSPSIGAPASSCAWPIGRDHRPVGLRANLSLGYRRPHRAVRARDALFDRDDWSGTARWFGELIARYPSDARASLARFRLAARAYRAGQFDSAAALYQGEVTAGGPQRTGARFWLGKVALARGDSAGARDIWRALAREDSLGYYGLRARRETDLPPLAIAPLAAVVWPAPAGVATGLARLDTLLLAGLDSEAQIEVRAMLGRPPQDLDALLALSEGLGLRGFGSAGVRLGWQAFVKAPGDVRVLRAIYPWPVRTAVEAEAQEFGVDAKLLVAIVRQESVFDIEALSPAGARGLVQLTPGTAAITARGLDVTFYPEWITVPDLNLHLGAAHLAELLRRFGRLEAAIAAYNAGTSPVIRWLERDGADDPDQFIELIPYPETRGYVRSVIRNRELYRALYAAP